MFRAAHVEQDGVGLSALERPELGVLWYTHAVCAVAAGPLRAMGGLSVVAPHGLEAIDAADTVVIPGWSNALYVQDKRIVASAGSAAGLGSGESLRRHFRNHGLPPPPRCRRPGRTAAGSARVAGVAGVA
jgi:hypothetical protein